MVGLRWMVVGLMVVTGCGADIDEHESVVESAIGPPENPGPPDDPGPPEDPGPPPNPGPPCASGFGNCDGIASNRCETPLDTIDNCGGCGNACTFANGAAACTNGACELAACTSGFGNCDLDAGTGCETVLDTNDNCGACGNACAFANGAAACTNGACELVACTGGYGNCDLDAGTGCETALDTTADCGACGNQCAYANGAAACTSGACELVACTSGYGNCDLDAGTGCETALDTIASCGACGTQCSYAHASATCAAGACALGTCDAGYADCDATPTSGCETDTLADANHCGACGNVCGAGETCASGACEPILTCTSQTLTDTFNVPVWDYYGNVRAQWWNYQGYTPFDARLGTLRRVTVEQTLNVSVDLTALWYGDTYSFRMIFSGDLWTGDTFTITEPTFTKHYSYVFDQAPNWTNPGWGYYFESVAIRTPHVVTNTAVLTYCYEPNRRVFLTSTFYDGNFGGLAGADAKCQERADAAGLTGTYKAWLSDDTTSAGSRLEHSPDPYILVDGTVVANDWSQLGSSFLAHAIDKTELGGPPTVIWTGCGSWAGVFTGTRTPNGSSWPGQTCQNWTSSSSSDIALIGHAFASNSHWTNLCSYQPCSTPTPLYCIEQR
ncbi:MAG TPA: hypothetical protein VIV11_11755 [Kofleriaceae bacterium]